MTKKNQFVLMCSAGVAILSWAAHIQLREQAHKENQAVAPRARPRISPAGTGGRISSPRPLAEVDLMRKLTVHATEPHPDHPGLEDPRAGRVEMRSRERLARLRESLDLSIDQQRRIFPILARCDPEFQVSMSIGPDRSSAGQAGATGTRGSARTATPRFLAPTEGTIPAESSTRDHSLATSAKVAGESTPSKPAETSPSETADPSVAILRELTPEQQAAYEESLIDEGLWWSDIINQIESEYERTHAAGPSDPAVLEDEGAGESLFDLIGQ